MPNALSNISPSSDAGGISARKGFRFQDHVAAYIALEMLYEHDILQIECETGDDIVLRRKKNDQNIIEYIQVKTTSSNTNWSIQEVTSRINKKEGSSVCEKSLLCDKHGELAWFRLISDRAINFTLQPFSQRLGNDPTNDKKLTLLIEKFSEKFKKTKSKSGRNITYWAKNMLWEVVPDEESLKARSINQILQFFNNQGVNPTYEHGGEIYRKLVDKMRSMGDQSSQNNEGKIWERTEYSQWWKNQINKTRVEKNNELKVYQLANYPKFFTKICSMKESDIKKALYSYNVEFDGNVWREKELIDYLIDWLPEVTLPAGTLARFNHLTARQIPKEALKALKRHHSIDISQIISALMLHAIIRCYFSAEPIACRIFSLVDGIMRSSSAHIVQFPDREEIWLGRSQLVSASSHESVTNNVLAELRTSLMQDVIKEERDIIIQLREPQHLNDSQLDKVLSKAGKISEFRKILHLPLLIAYDSAILKNGFTDDYLDNLKKEVNTEYARIKKLLGKELDSVQISLFLIPVQCALTLSKNFEKELR